MLIETRADVDQQIASWQAQHTGPAVPLAALLCDRHASRAGRLALRYQDAAGTMSMYSFGEMRDRSVRFAGVLRSLGVRRGDGVATLQPKSPELMIATLGIWRLGAVHVPLFTAFGPQAIAFRTGHSATRVIIITDLANRPKLAGLDLPVITVEDRDRAVVEPGDLSFRAATAASRPSADVVRVSGDEPFILIYTSGTTSQSKGVDVPTPRAPGSSARWCKQPPAKHRGGRRTEVPPWCRSTRRHRRHALRCNARRGRPPPPYRNETSRGGLRGRRVRANGSTHVFNSYRRALSR
jgi:acyl-CoA synthetase (AMP-forming)/AMP-acid ligase II